MHNIFLFLEHCESEDYEDLPNIDDDDEEEEEEEEEENGGKIQNGPYNTTEPTTTINNEIKMKKNENENVIQVKEYSSPKDDDNDIVFVKLPS